MEERKQKEREHYNASAQRHLQEQGIRQLADEGFSPSVLASYRFLHKIAGSVLADKKVLDYGCGNGVHTAFLAQHAREVVGIDLSEVSLIVAKQTHHKLAYKVSFQAMDCENLGFPDNSFEAVFDGGTFSSLDFQKAMEEITRILVPNGVLVGIETFGHNPFANAKRVFNRITGKRTEWAASHIVTKKEIELLRANFEQVEVYYFHLVSLFAFPFLNLPGGQFVLELGQYIDGRLIFRIPFFRKYAFKVVFVCKNPRHDETTV